MKIRITKENEYVKETRGIKLNDVLTVRSSGPSERAGRGTVYLVDGNIGNLPIVIYEDECEIVDEDTLKVSETAGESVKKTRKSKKV